jgi:hypothetical protein
VHAEGRQIVATGVDGQRVERKNLAAHATIVQGLSDLGNRSERILDRPAER